MCQIRVGDVTVRGGEGWEFLKLKSKQGKAVKDGCLKKGGAIAILQTMYMLLHSCNYHKKISINIYKRGD